MKVDIWSDVRCPFCYIGKRHFEEALKKFPQRDKVEVEWHSFQLDPNLVTQPEINTVDYFVKVKNITHEQALKMFEGAREMGKKAGVDLRLEETVVSNSFKAHQVIQLAKTKGFGNEIEEAFFEAYFSKTKNIDDIEVLVEIGTSVGLSSEDIREALSNESFAYEVKQDEMTAQNIGVRGVPFFVFNRKYAVSGAQPPEAFLEVLQKSWQES